MLAPKQCDGFQTGNYLSHSNEGGSGGNGDEWRARGQREEGEWRLLFRTPLCQLLNVYLTHTHRFQREGKNNHIPQRQLPCGSLGLKKTIYIHYCTVSSATKHGHMLSDTCAKEQMWICAAIALPQTATSLPFYSNNNDNEFI